MGRYAKIADFPQTNKVLTYLTRPEETSETTPDDDKLNEAIDDAESYIDGYVAKQNDMPLKMEIPRSLRVLTLDVAIYYLWKYRKSAIPEDIRTSFTDSVKDLEKIASGETTLGANTSEQNVSSLGITGKIERS